MYLNFIKYLTKEGKYLTKLQLGEGTLPWATPCLGPSRFFFKWEENKYFSPYEYRFIFKWPIKSKFCWNSYFVLFFLKSYFFDKESKFLDVRFYWNKKVKHRFIYERRLKLVWMSSEQSFLEKRIKSLLLIRY